MRNRNSHTPTFPQYSKLPTSSPAFLVTISSSCYIGQLCDARCQLCLATFSASHISILTPKGNILLCVTCHLWYWETNSLSDGPLIHHFCSPNFAPKPPSSQEADPIWLPLPILIPCLVHPVPRTNIQAFHLEFPCLSPELLAKNIFRALPPWPKRSPGPSPTKYPLDQKKTKARSDPTKTFQGGEPA
jgi:hypothetical protein